MEQLRNYTTPKIATKGKDWFVYFRFYHAGKWHLRKLREQLNRIPDKKERKRHFEVLCDIRTEWLSAGWNPIIDPEFKARNIIKSAKLAEMTFNEAMSFAIEKKKPDLASKSYTDYNNVLSIVKDMAIDTGIGNLPVTSIERPQIMDLLEKIFKKRKFSNSRYNFYLVTIQAMFSKLETWTVVKYNPALKIEGKPVAGSDKYKVFTPKEKEDIAKCLIEKHPPFFVYLQTIYHTGIREKELLLLQVKDIDLIERSITITPDLERENSKTKDIRPIPISNALLPFFEAMNLENYPRDYYVFGSPFEPGKGNKGAKDGVLGAMRSDFLTPSKYHARRNTVTNLWDKLIKEGLGIDKYLYAAKHTGADDKIRAGIELDALRNLYGHRSKYMTEKYAKAIMEIRNGKIREQSPSFTPARILKIA